jgi:hypothetical protein
MTEEVGHIQVELFLSEGVTDSHLPELALLYQPRLDTVT